MNSEEITIRKTPFLFLKWLVIIEFLFALLPFLIVTLLKVRDSYSGSALAETVSYSVLVAIGMTTIQVLIIAVSFVAWYLPVYRADRKQIAYLRPNLFEDKTLVQTPAITDVGLRQGWLGKRLDYGTLILTTRANPDQARIKDIPNPRAYVDRIRRLVEPAFASPGPPKPKSINELLSGGESQHVEYKSSLLWDYRQQVVNKALYEPVMKNLVAFMNSTGGILLIGVADDGQVLGLEPDYRSIRKPDSDGFENVFGMAFNKMIGVEHRQFVDVTCPEIDGKEICMVSVRPASEPAYLVHRGKETFYIRAGNAAQPLTVSQAARYIHDRFDR
jgi:membrane protein YdbS with pleckstrin-like domain